MTLELKRTPPEVSFNEARANPRSLVSDWPDEEAKLDALEGNITESTFDRAGKGFLNSDANFIGRHLIGAGNIDGALKFGRKLKAGIGRNRYFTNMIRYTHTYGDPATAHRFISEIDDAYWSKHASVLDAFGKGNYEEAIKAVDSHEDIGPVSGQKESIYTNAGELLADHGRLEQAWGCVQKLDELYHDILRNSLIIHIIKVIADSGNPEVARNLGVYLSWEIDQHTAAAFVAAGRGDAEGAYACFARADFPWKYIIDLMEILVAKGHEEFVLRKFYPLAKRDFNQREYVGVIAVGLEKRRLQWQSVADRLALENATTTEATSKTVNE